MADPMRIRAKAAGDKVTVKILMAHPMETGLRKKGGQGPDAAELIPAKYIKRVDVKCNDKLVLGADWGPAVSKNPYLSFRFNGGKAGDKLSVHWLDTSGDTRTDEVTID